MDLRSHIFDEDDIKEERCCVKTMLEGDLSK